MRYREYEPQSVVPKITLEQYRKGWKVYIGTNENYFKSEQKAKAFYDAVKKDFEVK